MPKELGGAEAQFHVREVDSQARAGACAHGVVDLSGGGTDFVVEPAGGKKSVVRYDQLLVLQKEFEVRGKLTQLPAATDQDRDESYTPASAPSCPLADNSRPYPHLPTALT